MLARDPELQRRIGGAVEELDRIIRDLRNYIFGLRPGILADRQLDQALRRLGEELEQKTGVVTVVEVDPDAPPRWQRRPLRWCSSPGRPCPTSAATPKPPPAGCRCTATVVLEVDDDGRGFDPARTRPSGQGLRNLGARAQALGGGVEIDSRSGEGTRVRVQLRQPSLPSSK